MIRLFIVFLSILSINLQANRVSAIEPVVTELARYTKKPLRIGGVYTTATVIQYFSDGEVYKSECVLVGNASCENQKLRSLSKKDLDQLKKVSVVVERQTQTMRLVDPSPGGATCMAVPAWSQVVTVGNEAKAVVRTAKWPCGGGLILPSAAAEELLRIIDSRLR